MENNRKPNCIQVSQTFFRFGDPRSQSFRNACIFFPALDCSEFSFFSPSPSCNSYSNISFSPIFIFRCSHQCNCYLSPTPFLFRFYSRSVGEYTFTKFFQPLKSFFLLLSPGLETKYLGWLLKSTKFRLEKFWCFLLLFYRSFLLLFQSYFCLSPLKFLAFFESALICSLLSNSSNNFVWGRELRKFCPCLLFILITLGFKYLIDS